MLVCSAAEVKQIAFMATPIPKNQARFTIEEIASATRGTILTMLPHYRVEVKGLVTDSRAVMPGSVFVALKGHCVPGGNDFDGSPAGYSCEDTGTFVFGEVAMQFFLAHPKD